MEAIKEVSNSVENEEGQEGTSKLNQSDVVGSEGTKIHFTGRLY